MTARSFVVAMLGVSAFVTTPSVFAQLIKAHHYYVGDDEEDDRDEWGERHERKKGKKDKDARKYGYYRYERAPVVMYTPPPAIATPKPPSPSRSFPRESATAHAAAKERQRELLEKEFAAEQQLLADARARLDEESVQHHERNLEALRRELRNLQP